jgi:hypothetical protein
MINFSGRVVYICNSYVSKELRQNEKGINRSPFDLSPLVHSKGFEPPSSEPESEILSVELRMQYFTILNYEF